MNMPKIAARTIAAQVTSCAPRSPIQRPKKPAMMEPMRGRKTAAAYKVPLAFHQVDVFDRDRAAIAEIDDEDCEADRRLGRRDGQDEHGEDLADEIMQEGGESDEVDVDREQHQLDRHQDDDHVLAVEEDAEDAEGEEDRGDGQVMRQADFEHVRPPAPAGPSPPRPL